MAKTKIEKIASIEEEIKQLENKKKRLIQEQKEQERKDRTNRPDSAGGRRRRGRGARVMGLRRGREGMLFSPRPRWALLLNASGNLLLRML